MVLKIIFVLSLLFLIKAPLAWGFSVERTEAYVHQGISLNLASDPQWLRLGHYHPNWHGSLRSKIRGNFFLAPNGSQDPVSELQATIRTLFSEKTSAMQCRYLARTQWLKKALNISSEDILTCPKVQTWKAKLNAREIFIIFAANDLNSAASSFGHTFLRLHDPTHVGSLELIDYGVNFAAQTDDSDGALFALKGLFGYYPGYYSMMPFHQKMREYVNLEGRDLWEYRLNLSSEQVDFIVDHLLELEGSYVPYYFLDDNCSYQLLELIEVAKPDLHLTSQFHDVTIPLDTLKVLATQKDFLGSEKRRPSLKRSFQFSFHELKSSEKTQLVDLARAMDRGQPPPDLKLQDPRVLDAALAYADLKTYKGQENLKDWRYQLALTRSQKGVLEELKSPPEPGSPLNAATTQAWALGMVRYHEKNFGELKFRRAFHDLLSRDDGVAPFSHLELLSASVRRPFDEGPLDLHELTLIKILSTLAVDRLEDPLSWKAAVGTHDKLNPRLEGGLGFSFDYDILGESRWVNLATVRGFRAAEKDYLVGGLESLWVQKYSDRLRALIQAQYLGGRGTAPFLETKMALSFDLTPKYETRLSWERVHSENEFLIQVLF